MPPAVWPQDTVGWTAQGHATTCAASEWRFGRLNPASNGSFWRRHHTGVRREEGVGQEIAPPPTWRAGPLVPTKGFFSTTVRNYSSPSAISWHPDVRGRFGRRRPVADRASLLTGLLTKRDHAPPPVGSNSSFRCQTRFTGAAGRVGTGWPSARSIVSIIPVRLVSRS